MIQHKSVHIKKRLTNRSLESSSVSNPVQSWFSFGEKVHRKLLELLPVGVESFPVIHYPEESQGCRQPQARKERLLVLTVGVTATLRPPFNRSPSLDPSIHP